VQPVRAALRKIKWIHCLIRYGKKLQNIRAIQKMPTIILPECMLLLLRLVTSSAITVIVKYDCSNESRPGVVSEVLTPDQAVKKNHGGSGQYSAK